MYGSVVCRTIHLLKNWANPGLFFVYFWSFQSNITIFCNKYMWKNVHPVYGRDSNPRPSERESPPIATRPGLLPTRPYKMKSCPMFIKCCPKSSDCSFLFKSDIFRSSQRNHQIFGLLLLQALSLGHSKNSPIWSHCVGASNLKLILLYISFYYSAPWLEL